MPILPLCGRFFTAVFSQESNDMSPAIEQDTVLKRVNGIQGEVDELRKLGNVPVEQFKAGLEYPDR